MIKKGRVRGKKWKNISAIKVSIEGEGGQEVNWGHW